jgi:hypothetical protein
VALAIAHLGTPGPEETSQILRRGRAVLERDVVFAAKRVRFGWSGVKAQASSLALACWYSSSVSPPESKSRFNRSS